MKDIVIRQIKYKDQQYDTVGNYRKVANGNLIEVSKLKGYVKDDDELAAVALHEMVEMLLCIKRKIKFKDIDNFDIAFKGDGEPGNEKDAPYHKEHRFADMMEQLFLNELKKSA